MERAFLRFDAASVRNRAETPSPRPSHGPDGGPDDRLAGLVEAFCFHAYSLLDDERGAGPARRDALARLADRGFDPNQTEQLPVGLVVTPDALEQRLLGDGFTSEEVRRSKLVADRRLAGRLVGPITDLAGRITSFWACHTDARQPAYLFWRGGWRQHVAAFGLQTALGAAGADGRIVLVEDILDSLLLRSRGLRNAAALGDPIRRLDAGRWQQLAAAGVRRVTLVGDARPGTGACVLAVLEAAFAAEAAPSIDVVEPGVLAGTRTPGEFVRRQGMEAFRAVLAERLVHAYTLKARDVLGRRRPPCGWTVAARRAAMDEAVAFYTWQSARRRETAELDAHFVPPIIEELGWAWGAADAREEAREEEVTREESPREEIRDEPRPSGYGYCTLHGCAETDCFCFD